MYIITIKGNIFAQSSYLDIGVFVIKNYRGY